MFSIFPKDDPKQTLRLKRFFMAFASYIMWIDIVSIIYFFSKEHVSRLTPNILVIGFFGIFISNIPIYVMIRTGFNKQFKDPSLTLLQMIMATFWIMVIVYYAGAVKSLVLLVYLVVYVFGLFKLNIRQFLFLSAFAVVSYSLVIFLLYKNNTELVNKIDILNILILALVLPWFSLVGGYITKLRTQISHAFSTIEKLAITDDLTQVFNRRQMYKILEDQKALGDRGIHPFSICIFDLDHFKRVNDNFGHAAGDIVLKTVAQETQQNLRNIDHIARYGGEEFILILANSEKREAMECAERIRKTVERLVFENLPNDFRITISVGVAEYQSGEAIQKSINRSDKALYRAKLNGRNRVEYEPAVTI